LRPDWEVFFLAESSTPPLFHSIPQLCPLLSQIDSLPRRRIKRRRKMTVGMINANPVVHERPERAAHPHAADALDPLDVFGRVLQSSPRESISLGSFSSAFA
jgi:hypothetical protein